MTGLRKKRRHFGSGVPTGFVPGHGPRGPFGSDPFSDSLRASGIVEDREPRGLAAHKRAVARRRGRFPQPLRDALAAVGIRVHDHAAAAEELTELKDRGTVWRGPNR